MGRRDKKSASFIKLKIDDFNCFLMHREGGIDTRKSAFLRQTTDGKRKTANSLNVISVGEGLLQAIYLRTVQRSSVINNTLSGHRLLADNRELMTLFVPGEAIKFKSEKLITVPAGDANSERE